jgi:hypothetical protein
MATNRTTDPRDKALKSARAKALSNASRELDVLGNAIEEHRKDLKAGTVPEQAFVLRALKYEQARTRLELCDALRAGAIEETEDEAETEAAASQLREDVAALLQVVAELAPELQPVEGYPLYRLREFTDYGRAVADDEQPAEEAGAAS